MDSVTPMMSPDRPNGADLLDVARRALLDEIAPALSGRQRYVALMVANAIGIAQREIAEGDASRRAWERAASAASIAGDDPIPALAASIREGRHDADPALYGALCETAEVAARIWKPARIEGVDKTPKD